MRSGQYSYLITIRWCPIFSNKLGIFVFYKSEREKSVTMTSDLMNNIWLKRFDDYLFYFRFFFFFFISFYFYDFFFVESLALTNVDTRSSHRHKAIFIYIFFLYSLIDRIKHNTQGSLPSLKDPFFNDAKTTKKKCAWFTDSYMCTCLLQGP